jgi:hypothetical protein
VNKFAALGNLKKNGDIIMEQYSNIKISAQGNLGYCESKHRKPLFDEECSKYVDQRKQANCSGFRIQVK